jgi:glyoxylase-like metal-dependent hydrolase (beta-lactamase superfamily II)/rhodanese-related sulfurtransferase
MHTVFQCTTNERRGTMTLTQSSPPAIELSPRDLYARLLLGEPLLILDVRNQDEYQRMKIEGQRTLAIMNLPYFAFLEDEDAAVAQLPAEHDEIVVVCAKGGASLYVAEVLNSRGFSAVSLSEGMIGWGNYYDLRDVAHTNWGRIVQIARPARGDLSFAVISDGQAALIDPLRNLPVYRDLVAENGAELTYIFDTHVHADHISGGPALAQATGAPYFVHAYDAIHPIDMLPATIAYTSLADGQQFSLGQLTITTIWYPGHTLGQVNFLVTAPDGGDYLFTGDGIFLRSFGRPDLGGKGATWTPLLYASMFERLPRHVTDTTIILPAHFSALEEDAGNGIFAAPYAQVRAQNDGLRPRSLAEFTTFVLSHLPVFPPEYVEIKRVNLGLAEACDGKASELELGKNICALSN